MANWSAPGAGFNTFTGSTEDLWTAWQDYDGISDSATTNKTAMAAAFTGSGSEALQSTLQVFNDTIPGIQSVLTKVTSALNSYNNSLGSVVSSAEHLLNEMRRVQAALDNPERPIWDLAGRTEDAVEEAVRNARLVELRIELEGLYRYRRGLDATVISALNTAMPASWADQSSAFASAGITQSMLLSSSQSQQAMLDLAEKMLAGDVSTENVAALNGLLSARGSSPTTMSSFFSSLGGANTAQLIDQLGEEMSFVSGDYSTLSEHDQAIMTLALRVRSALAVGAEDWGQEFANGYMTDMMTGNADYWENRGYYQGTANDADSGTARAQAVSFLFSDPLGTPMPEELTYGAALAIDQLERVDHATDLVNFVAYDVSASASVFSLVENWGSEDYSYNDLPGRVFETLGLYPDSAFEFLTTGDDRIEYWFGERDWSASDDFSGPAALWLGAQQVEGGVYNTGDSSLAQESAIMSGEIFAALAGNPSFIPESVNDEAGANLAASFLLNIEALTEIPLMSTPEGTTADYWDVPLKFSDPPEMVFGPKVTNIDLSLFLSVVSGNDAGASTLVEGATSYQRALIEIANISDAPNAASDAMDRINMLQGLVDGASIAGDLNSGERADTRSQSSIDGISALLGAIPVSSLGDKVLDGGFFVMDMLQNGAQGAGSDFVANGIAPVFGLTTDNMAGVYDLYFDTAEERAQGATRYFMASALFGMYSENGAPITLPTGEVIPPPPAANSADYPGWYSENSGNLQKASLNTVTFDEEVRSYTKGVEATIFEATHKDEAVDAYANN